MLLSENKSKVNTLSNIFVKYNKKIKKEFRGVDFEDYKVIETTQIRNRIAKLVKELVKESQVWVKENILEVYNQAFDIGKSYIPDLKNVNKIDHKAEINDIQEKTWNDLILASHSILVTFDIYCYLSQRANEGLKQFQAFTSGAGFAIEDEIAISEIISNAIAEGKRPGYANTLIKKYFSEQITKGNCIRVKNREYTLKYYSRMVARTRMNEAQTTGVLNACKQYDNDLVEVSSHGTVCLICTPYEGEVFSISGKTKGYSILLERPPYHPHCMHHLYPTSVEILGVEEKFH